MAKKVNNNQIAKAFAGDEAYAKDLLYCRDWVTFYLYKNYYYQEINQDEMYQLIWDFIDENYPETNLTMTLVKDVFLQIGMCCSRVVQSVDTDYIALEDALLNLSDFSLHEFDRKKIAIHKLKVYKEDLNQPTPQFQQFLDTTIVDAKENKDEELQTLVQEMFGYYLINNLKGATVFFLVGQGANGKSVMISVIEEMIGIKAISSMSIQTLTTNRFAPSNLIGKKLNVCNEEESKYLKADKFKAMVTGDSIDAERKFGASFSFKPKAKFLFATNEMPTFDGLNIGIKRRIKIIPFHKIFTDEEQDKDLTEKLLTEIGGVIGWAIIGAQRFVSNGYRFSNSKVADNAKAEFEDSVSSALAFFNESYTLEESTFISHDNGRDHGDDRVRRGRKSGLPAELESDTGQQVVTEEMLQDLLIPPFN